MCVSVVRAGKHDEQPEEVAHHSKVHNVLEHSGGMKPCTGACHTMTDDVIESVL